MPFHIAGNTKMYYRLEGNSGAPVLVLSHSIGTDHGMWEAQIPGLIRYFQVLRYDTRGHGASDSPAGEYSVDQLSRDVLALADGLGIQRFAFCGLSMGGAIGQRLAGDAPQRITHLVLANTGPKLGTPENWETRIRAVTEKGMSAIVDMAMQRFFSSETLQRRDPQADSVRAVFLATNPAGYAGCCAALRDFDGNASLHKIPVPTLVIVGKHDVSTPRAGHGEILCQKISGAKCVELDAAHLANLEQPHSFTAAVAEFLLGDAHAEPLPSGFKIRRAVLGDEHVDRAIANTTDLNREFQDLITRYAWGTVWTRPGLDIRTRRLLVLALMAALGRHEEFRMHLRAGLKNGMEISDLKEVLLQCAIYAGVPVANTAFQIASEELEKK